MEYIKMEYAARLQAFRDGVAALQDNDGDQMDEIISDVAPLTPEALGQLIMQHLPVPDDSLSLEQKMYWMCVGDHMGPDFLASLRKVAAFMDKTESFR